MKKVEDSIVALEGVDSAHANLATERVQVSYSPDVVKESQLLAAVAKTDAGFTVTGITA